MFSEQLCQRRLYKGVHEGGGKKEEDFGLYTLVPETGTIFGHLQKD